MPHIIALEPDGVLTIGWNYKMITPMNYSAIPPTRVAVQPDIDVNSLRFWQRRNQYNKRGRELRSYEDFELLFTEQNMVYLVEEEAKKLQRMQLLEALELIITPEDEERAVRLDFTWVVIDYNEDTVKLRLEFKNPAEVSQDMTFDTLSVTFWGVDFFRNK